MFVYPFRMNVFKDNFLFSGSMEGKVYVWNLYRSLENAFNCDNEENILPLCSPSWELNVGDVNADITCVAVDQQSGTFVHNTEDFKFYKWSLNSSKLNDFQRFTEFRHGIPKVQAHVKAESVADKMVIVPTYLDCFTRKRTSPLQLSNWFQTQKDGLSIKRPKIASSNPELSLISSSSSTSSFSNLATTTSMSTSKKDQNRSTKVKKKNSRKELFSNNRKISEFFTP